MRVSLAAALLLLPLRAALGAEPLLVPEQYPTIQAAVDAAVNGDTIQIRSGTYAEAVSVVNVIGLTIVGKGKVVIEPPFASIGLTLTLCTECRFEKLTVKSPATTGIQLHACFNTSVVKCRIEGASGHGLHVRNSIGIRIESCTITDSGSCAIALGESAILPATTCSVLHCKLSGALLNGIRVRGNGNTIVGNLVSGADQGGLEVSDGFDSTDNAFTGNRISECGIGIVTAGDADVISGNTITHTLDDAILLVTGSGHTVVGNKLAAPHGSGVFANANIPGVVLSQNKLTKPGDRGVYLGCDGAAVVGNSVKGAGSDGFGLDGNAVLCLGNTAIGNTRAGFVLSGEGQLLSGNKAKGNAGFDLDDVGANNSIDATNSFGTVAP